MRVIEIETFIAAPIERIFKLASCIDLHIDSNASSGETVVKGKQSGLIELGDQLTWEARHFGVRQQLTVKVTAFEENVYFEDEMLKGAFASMHHRHEFREVKAGVMMEDTFQFAAPLGVLGGLAEWLFLESYMHRFLKQKAAVLKRVAESDEWEQYL